MRRPRRVARDAAPAALFPELVDVLLEGWSAPIRPERDERDAFKVFDYQEEDVARLRREHAAWLHAEAARRGLVRTMLEDNAAQSELWEQL